MNAVALKVWNIEGSFSLGLLTVTVCTSLDSQLELEGQKKCLATINTGEMPRHLKLEQKRSFSMALVNASSLLAPV